MYQYVIYVEPFWSTSSTYPVESWLALAFVFPSLQNKEFVCRGYDYERLEDFQQRMLGEFPQAIAMQHPNQPDDTILQSDAQCILLCFIVELQLFSTDV